MVVKRKVRLLAVLGIVLVFAIIAIVGTKLIGNAGSPEEKLTKRLETIGADFYENFYHGQISSNKTEEEIKEFLERYSEIGIKVDIDNLGRFDDKKYGNLTEEFINKKDKIPCDVRNTRAVIYPKEPFGAKNFTVKGELDCGFTVQDNGNKEDTNNAD